MNTCSLHPLRWLGLSLWIVLTATSSFAGDQPVGGDTGRVAFIRLWGQAGASESIEDVNAQLVESVTRSLNDAHAATHGDSIQSEVLPLVGMFVRNAAARLPAKTVATLGIGEIAEDAKLAVLRGANLTLTMAARKAWPIGTPAAGDVAASAEGNPWTSHRDAVIAAWPTGLAFAPAFEIGVDLNAMRAAAPEFMSRPDVMQSLQTLGLINARHVMLHGRLIASKDIRLNNARSAATLGAAAGPALLAIDLTWSVRSGPLNNITRVSIAAPFWPAAECSIAPPSCASVVAVVRADLGGVGPTQLGAGFAAWSRLVGQLTCILNGPAADIESRQRELTRWYAAYAASPRRITNAGSRWLILGIVPNTKPGTLPSLMAVSPMRSPSDADDIAKSIVELADTLKLPSGKTASSPPGADATIRAWLTYAPPVSLGLGGIHLSCCTLPSNAALVCSITLAPGPESQREAAARAEEIAKSLRSASTK